MAKTKKNLIAELTNAGIAHDPAATIAVLSALLPQAGGAATPEAQVSAPVATAPAAPAETPAPTATDDLDIQVADPEVLRPKELPLVVTPGKGKEWKNPEQAEYARTLNGYAYRNPAKWGQKKAKLLANLVEIGSDPRAIIKFRSNEDGHMTFKNKLIEN